MTARTEPSPVLDDRNDVTVSRTDGSRDFLHRFLEMKKKHRRERGETDGDQGESQSSRNISPTMKTMVIRSTMMSSLDDEAKNCDGLA